MASNSFVYAAARLALNTAQIDLSSATIGAALVTANYSPQPAVDQFLSVIPPSAIVGQADLTGVTLNSSGCLLGTLVFNSFTAAQKIVAVVLYVDTGNSSTSQLLYYSSGGPGFPWLAQGFNYAIGYDQNSGGFFQ